jgi:hypothetical protein
MACFPLATLLWFNQLSFEDGRHVSLHQPAFPAKAPAAAVRMISVASSTPDPLP